MDGELYTIGECRRRGQLLEIYCGICGRYGYFTHEKVPLPEHLAFPDAIWHLRRATCGARNRRLDERFPLFMRPDACVETFGKRDFKPTITNPGRDWYQQEKYLMKPINAWLANVRSE